MPRAKMETAFIGRYTLAALDAAPDAAFLWLGRALFAWILRDELPSEIPPEHLAAWTMIREESQTIHEARKADIENGKKGGRPKGNPWKPMETNGNPTEPKETQGAETETKRESKSKSNSSPSYEGSLTARDPGEEFTPSYIVDDWAALKMQAHNVGLTDTQLDAWRDYYAAQGWRFKPTAAAPMNKTEALASIRNWARAEKRLEIRSMQRDPSKFAPPPEKGGIDTAALGI